MDLCNVCVCVYLFVSCEKLSIICIAKNNFKDDFLNIQMFLHPQIPDLKYCPNHTSMEILLIQLSDDA